VPSPIWLVSGVIGAKQRACGDELPSVTMAGKETEGMRSLGERKMEPTMACEGSVALKMRPTHSSCQRHMHGSG
jgi:hypothetical protein